MTMKKCLALGLTVIMVLLVMSPVYAQEAGASHINVRVLDSVTDEHGETVREVALIGDVVYLYEATDEHVLCIGLARNGMADVSVVYLDDGSVLADLVDVKEFVPHYRGRSVGRAVDTVDMIRDLVLGRELPLSAVDGSLLIDDSFEIMTSGHETRIMNELYNAGWPTAYHNVLRATMTRDGVYAELRHSVSYNLVEQSAAWGWIGALVTTVSILAALPPATIVAIASVVMGAYGVYEFATNVHVKKYNVFCYGNKWVKIGDVYPYNAGRTVKWVATVADLGATLSFSYDHHHFDYFDNTALLNTGIDNYLLYH